MAARREFDPDLVGAHYRQRQVAGLELRAVDSLVARRERQPQRGAVELDRAREVVDWNEGEVDAGDHAHRGSLMCRCSARRSSALLKAPTAVWSIRAAVRKSIRVRPSPRSMNVTVDSPKLRWAGSTTSR